MLRVIGLFTVIGAIYLFLNWEEYGDDVGSALDSVNAAAEHTADLREDIKDKAEALADELKDD